MFNQYRLKEVLAESINYDETDGYVKEWTVNGEKVTLGVKKR